MNKADYLDLIDLVKTKIEEAFQNAVARRVALAKLSEIVDAVAAGDTDAVLRIAGLSASDATELVEAARAGFIAAGVAESATIGVVFDVSNARAQMWLANESSTLITLLTSDQRAAVSRALESGMSRGMNPRNTALNIVGRVGADGMRSGGIVGLTPRMAGYVESARRELLTGDHKYFTRTLRDKRFDAIARKPMTQTQVDAIVGRYAARLLKWRGDTIARTESLRAVAAARGAFWEQAIAEGVVERGDITRVWSATMDKRTRDSHQDMDGQRRTYGVPFESSSGALLMFPGDVSMNAPPEETINCRCMEVYKVNHAARARREVASV